MPRSKRNTEQQKIFAESLQRLIDLQHVKDRATLAKATGIDPSQISRYLGAKAMPDVYAALALARFFGVSVAELVTGVVQPSDAGPPAGPNLIDERLLEIDRRVGGIARIFHERTAELAENNKARIDDLSRRLDTAVKSASNRLDALGHQQSENMKFFTELFRVSVTVLTELHPGERDQRRIAPLVDMVEWMRQRKAGGGRGGAGGGQGGG